MHLHDYEEFLRTNVPMIAYSELDIVKIDQNQCIVKIPFISKNLNHIKSMYLGSLVIGAEVSAGILTFHLLQEYGINSTVVFKDFKASFLRLALKDVYFICTNSNIIIDHLKQANITKNRVNFSLNVIAVEDLNHLDDCLAQFELTASIKVITP